MNPVEPSSDMRTMAHTLREFYVALLNEGFTEDEALTMVSTAIKSAARGD